MSVRKLDSDIHSFIHLELGKKLHVVSINIAIFKEYAHSSIDN